MLDLLLGYLRCPRCGGPLRGTETQARCRACAAAYPVEAGVVDLVGADPDEVITPFQRLMQAPAVVAVYDRAWRPFGYRIAGARPFATELAAVLAQLDGCPGEPLLDLACGTGTFARPLARRRRRLTIGLDLSWPMLRRARTLAAREGVDYLALVRGSAFRLPFASGALPVVNCCGALHLFDRPDAALAEIARVLQPGGCLSVQTTIRPARSAGLAPVLERVIRFGFFEEAELAARLARHGLEIVRRERHRISFTFLARRRPDARVLQ